MVFSCKKHYPAFVHFVTFAGNYNVLESIKCCWISQSCIFPLYLPQIPLTGLWRFLFQDPSGVTFEIYDHLSSFIAKIFCSTVQIAVESLTQNNVRVPQPKFRPRHYIQYVIWCICKTTASAGIMLYRGVIPPEDCGDPKCEARETKLEVRRAERRKEVLGGDIQCC